MMRPLRNILGTDEPGSPHTIKLLRAVPVNIEHAMTEDEEPESSRTPKLRRKASAKLNPKDLIHRRLATFRDAETIGEVGESIHAWMVASRKADKAFPVLRPRSIENMIRLNKWGWWSYSVDKRWRG